MRTTDEIIHNGKTLTEILRLHRNWKNSEGVGIRADLRGADLTDTDLTDANLTGADLTGAYLRGADLADADLTGAYLRGADLTDTDLTGAYLRAAYLTDADLRGAKYRGITVKSLRMFTGLYKYNTVAAVAEDGTEYIGLGCHFKKASDWDGDGFWNNLSEFPNDGSVPTKKRQMSLRFAKEFLELYRENSK